MSQQKISDFHIHCIGKRNNFLSGVISGCSKDFHRKKEKAFRERNELVTYLRTMTTIVVMRAAKNTKAPNDERAMIELMLNLAP